MKENKIIKKTKTQKGITLIALIITIVTLLILASVAISSIQNDGILSYTENVANKYNQAQRDEQSVLDQYLGYLKGEEWTTIYDGAGVTENKQLLLANTHLFKNGNRYRITVESAEFTGTVETRAVFYNMKNGVQTYILFGVAGEQEVTANSLQEYVDMLEDVPENTDYTVVCGINITDSTNGNMSAIVLDGTSDCEYKILKIEEKVIGETGDSSLIFEGNFEINENGKTIIEGTKKPVSLAKKYRINLIVDGTEISLETITSQYFWAAGGFGCIATIEDKIIALGLNVNNPYTSCEFWCSANLTCTLKSIYEIGDSSTWVQENGFSAFNFTDGWGLVATHNTIYDVPDTVAEKTIDFILLEGLSGKPNFLKPINIVGGGDIIPRRDYKISFSGSGVIELVNDLVTNMQTPASSGSTIDLTQCGEDLEFSEELLSNLTTKGVTLYVTSAVKANYLDNVNIVVPQS